MWFLLCVVKCRWWHWQISYKQDFASQWNEFTQLAVEYCCNFIFFLLPYQSDWQAIRGAFVGCLALLHRKQGVGCIVISDVKRLLESFLQNVQVQSLAAADRKVDLLLQCKDAYISLDLNLIYWYLFHLYIWLQLCFQILSCILDRYPEVIKTMVWWLLNSICPTAF